MDVPGGGWLTVEFSTPTGVSELDYGMSRIVDVDGIGDTYFFQRLLPATDVVHRAFTTDHDDTWDLSAPATIDGTDYEPGPVDLPAGRHVLLSDAETVALSRSVASAPFSPFDGTVTSTDTADTDQLILTTRAFNEGLRGTVGGVPVEPVSVDSGMQAFRVPAGVAGQFTMTFAGAEFFRWSLIGGGAVSFLALVACVLGGILGGGVGPARLRRRAQLGDTALLADPPWLVTPLTFFTAILVAGAHGLLGWVIGWAVRRFTLIPAWALGGGAVAAMGLWLARAPWPSENYAGDSGAIMIAGCVALACVSGASRGLQRTRTTDTPPPPTPPQ